MCEYCEKGKKITDSLFATSEIKKIKDIKKNFNFYVLEINYSNYARINYCPMCGRKLGDEDK